MQVKHTPGKWDVTRHNDLSYCIQTDAPGYENGELNINDEEDYSNSALIAAAPDLLALVRDLIANDCIKECPELERALLVYQQATE